MFLLGLTRDQALKVADKVGLKDQRDNTADMLLKLYELFLKKDALLVELNPYAENADGRCKGYFNFFVPACSIQSSFSRF